MTDRTCSVDGCDGKVLARGWCGKHYQRWRVHGDPFAPPRPPGPAARLSCSVEGCDGLSNARGLCGRHYQQARRDGCLPETKQWPTACLASNCGARVYGHGLCRRHYARWRAYGSPEGPGNLEPEGRPAFGTKWCRKCGSYQPLAEFYIGKRGPESPCKACRAIRGKQYRKANPPRTRSDKNRRRRALERAARSERYTAIEIADRDGWVCQICRSRIGRTLQFPHPRSLSIDHIVPLAVGGDDTRVNVQAAHFRCNAAKRIGGADQLRLIG